MTPPIAMVLKLDQRALPQEVFERYAARENFRITQAARAEAAWESFGKPGRDPVRFGGVASALAVQGDWMPHLRIAQLNEHWDQVVGVDIARHSHVVSFHDGTLVIATESPTWATQLKFLVPTLSAVIQKRLEGLRIDDIRINGPSVGYSRKWAKRR